MLTATQSGYNFDHITIVDLPDNGVLEFDGNIVSAGDQISPDDIGLLVFIPDENGNGEDYATFNFTVSDGTDDSGEYTFSIDVTPLNDAPSSDDNVKVIGEDTTYPFLPADFVFSDVDGDSLDHITITELPADGVLTYLGNPVEAGDEIPAGNFSDLLFTPDANASGENYGNFKFDIWFM